MYKHREIYQALLKEILDGAYDSIQRLPSEAQLVRRFGVSRPTASRALRDLQSEGVIERRLGAGFDNVFAGYIAGQHMVKLGMRDLAFVARPYSAPTIEARVAGAREAMID